MSASSDFIVPIVNPFSLINIHSRYIDWRLYSFIMSLVYGNTGLDRKRFMCVFISIHILYFTPGYRFLSIVVGNK